MAIKDLTHATFGRLYVESLAYTKNNRAYWNCSCACGNKCIKMGKYLLDGSTKSCGCLAKESSVITGKNNQKHNNFNSKVGFVACLVLGIITTIFTFVWGIL